MNVLVTGGAGRVAKAIVERLIGDGHSVVAIGRTPGRAVPGARYVPADTTDIASMLSALDGITHIVHLAAIPWPGGAPASEVFRINCLGTFTVYEAAARKGIRRVVAASSINAFGYNFGCRGFPIPYLPVDEELPGFTTDAYSFSKQVTERIADYAWRRDGITSLMVRIPYVAPAERSDREPVRAHAERCRRSLESLMAMPEAARRERIGGWLAERERVRQERRMEAGPAVKAYVHPDPLMIGETDFWTRIDERDCAKVTVLGLTADFEGSEVVYAHDEHNITGLPSVTLASLFFPEAKLHEDRLRGTHTLVSIEKARKLLGFEPEYSVARWF